MRKGLTTASLLLLTFLVFPIFEVQGQSVQQVAIKDGEVLPLGNPHTWVNNCRLTMIGLPKLEILEGPLTELWGHAVALCATIREGR